MPLISPDIHTRKCSTAVTTHENELVPRVCDNEVSDSGWRIIVRGVDLLFSCAIGINGVRTGAFPPLLDRLHAVQDNVILRYEASITVERFQRDSIDKTGQGPGNNLAADKRGVFSAQRLFGTILLRVSRKEQAAAKNRKEEALNVLDKLTKLSSVRYISPFDVALVHMGLGNKDVAFEWLEKAYR
jgi:hypothetical protein